MIQCDYKHFMFEHHELGWGYKLPSRYYESMGFLSTLAQRNGVEMTLKERQNADSQKTALDSASREQGEGESNG